MRKRKECGNCLHFIKWKNDRIGGGLCVEMDMRTKTSYGIGCRKYKGIRYKRISILIDTSYYFIQEW